MPIVLDVDTGVDDALALLLALRHPDLELVAVTCVGGNVGLDQVLRNTLTVLEHAGAPADLPVARGVESPLLPAPATGSAPSLHGADGMADLGLPAPARTPIGADAVTLLAQHPDATVVACGPLTNLAALLEAGHRPARIVACTGRGARDEPPADFNVRADPAAAARVLDSGLWVTEVDAVALRHTAVPAHDVAALLAASDPAARLAGSLLRHQLDRFGEPAPRGDAAALATLVAPAVDRLTLARVFAAAMLG